MPLARDRAGDPQREHRMAAQFERRVDGASAAAIPPWPSRVPVPTIPGPIAQTTASTAARRQASAE